MLILALLAVTTVLLFFPPHTQEAQRWAARRQWPGAGVRSELGVRMGARALGSVIVSAGVMGAPWVAFSIDECAEFLNLGGPSII